MKRSSPFVLALVLCAVPGCIRTPKDVCREYVTAVNDLLIRCEIPYTYDVILDDDEVGCDYVGRVSDADSILNDCIPWTRSVECEELMFETDGTVRLDDDCNSGSFQGYDR